MKNKKERMQIESHIQTVFVVILILLVVMMMGNVSNLQGTARVINYAGIVRGATQRLVKLEMTENPNEALEKQLDTIIYGLRDGNDTLSLIRLRDEGYQERLKAQIAYWEQLKDVIHQVRNGDDETDLLNMSEEYFHMADDTVASAEIFSQQNASRLKYIEMALSFIILCIIVLMIRKYIEMIQLSKANHLLNQKAYIDLQTGLPNKSKCEELLREGTLISAPTALMMLDLNGLKHVNDTLGHVAGDALITNFAAILRGAVSDNDFVGRYGGDEFIIIQRNTSLHKAREQVESIQFDVEEFNRHGRGMTISFACGYAISTDYKECTLQALLQKADEHMYENKKEMKRSGQE